MNERASALPELPVTPGWRLVHLALGSNLASPAGDRLETLAAALTLLTSDDRVRLRAVSWAFETEAVPPGQPAFLNAAAAVETALALPELLARAQAVERSLGRVRRPEERWGPRTIDIDILADGESVLDGEGLSVPHPRLAERAFVLVPLAEIAADVVLPRWNESVRTLCERIVGASGSAEVTRPPNATAGVGQCPQVRRHARIPVAPFVGDRSISLSHPKPTTLTPATPKPATTREPAVRDPA
jgi:2-amino-4-hydroxy-6-hydroxymethyldihydropteridine diphosphokinase